MKGYKIVLASASPRRQELLSRIGLSFYVCPGNQEETMGQTRPEQIVRELSRQKAEVIFEKLLSGDIVLSEEACRRPDGIKTDGIKAGGLSDDCRKAPCLVIGADTVVSCDGRIMGKPADEKDARRMLNTLQGRSHQVYTGVTAIWQLRDGTASGRFAFYECTEVDFYPMDEREIAAYIATGEPMDKAGAYGIQGRCAAHIKGIRGDYNNVVGLPVGRLYQELRGRDLLG